MTVFFCGNKVTKESEEEYIEQMLRKIIKKLLCEYDATNFLVHQYGDFDKLAYNVLNELKKEYQDTNTFSIGIIEKLIIDDRFYTARCLDSEKEEKFDMADKDKFIVDCSDFVVSYVKYGWDDAYKTVEYAQFVNKPIIHIIPPGDFVVF